MLAGVARLDLVRLMNLDNESGGDLLKVPVTLVTVAGEPSRLWESLDLPAG
jgi:hypothetical protein